MLRKINNLRYTKKVLKNIIILLAITLFFNKNYAQFDQTNKVDGVEVVVGSNIVLLSDIIKFKEELERNPNYQRNEKISQCSILEDLMLRKLIAHHAVVDSVQTSEIQINESIKRQFDYFKQQLGGSEEKVLEFYGFDDKQSLEDALFKIEKEKQLVAKKKAEIVNSVNITPEEVRAYYRSLAKDEKLPEFGDEVSFAQIVIKVKPKEKSIQEVINKLNEIRKDLIAGGNFEIKALIYSKDPAVIDNKGAYTINKDSPFVREFKEVAFGLDEGEISEPFKTQFGYHIVKLEKIIGKNLSVKHILMTPEISDEEIKTTKEKISSIRDSIIIGTLDFKKAVARYSEDPVTRENIGVVINESDNTSSFELTRMDPKLYAKINPISEGGFTDPFIDETREGEKMLKFFKINKKTVAHKADLDHDYLKIYNLALARKKEETLDKWYQEHIKKTYIKINKHHLKCDFKYNWSKN